MDPDQHGQFVLFGSGRRLDVEVEAILGDQRLRVIGIRTDRLRRHSALDGCIENALPFLLRYGCFPAQFAYRRFRERNGIEGADAPVEEALDLPLLNLGFGYDFLDFTRMRTAVFQTDFDIPDQAVGGHRRSAHGVQLDLLGLFECQAVEFIQQSGFFNHPQVAAAFPAGQGFDAGNDAFDHRDFNGGRAIASGISVSEIGGVDDQRILLLGGRIAAGQGTDQCRRDQHCCDERDEH